MKKYLFPLALLVTIPFVFVHASQSMSAPSGLVAYNQNISVTFSFTESDWDQAALNYDPNGQTCNTMGNLPPGLSLNSSTGEISGTPSVAGSYTFSIQVKDANGATSAKNFTIVINTAPPVISTSSLPDGDLGSSYSQSLQAAGGSAPLNWSLDSGSLPAGLTLNSSGLISGTPTQVGQFNFVVRVSDSQNQTDTKSLGMFIHGDVITDIHPIADTFLKKGNPNMNQGADTVLDIQQSGKKRVLIKFDPEDIENALGDGAVESATLELNTTTNGNNWGANGRTIDIHRLLQDWTELGATWNCTDDTNTGNSSADCPGNTWDMDSGTPFYSIPTDTQLITNSTTGTVNFDVTSDIASFASGSFDNYGWVIKKTNEGQAGQIGFSSRETSSYPILRIVSHY